MVAGIGPVEGAATPRPKSDAPKVPTLDTSEDRGFATA